MMTINWTIAFVFRLGLSLFFFSDKLQKLTSKVPPLWPKKSLTTATLRHRSHTPRGCKPCSSSVLVIESLVSPKYTKTSVRAAKLEKYTEISWWLPWGCCVCVPSKHGGVSSIQWESWKNGGPIYTSFDGIQRARSRSTNAPSRLRGLRGARRRVNREWKARS